jgi:very-short-patch-repair endonuclease
MASISKRIRNGREFYLARWRDEGKREHGKSFARKRDAEDFLAVRRANKVKDQLRAEIPSLYIPASTRRKTPEGPRSEMADRLGISEQRARQLMRERDRKIITERGWETGSNLEDFVTRALSEGFKPDEVKQQFKIGRSRADYAWLDCRVILEVDGMFHRNPDSALKDANRDAWFRSDGWLVFRVDDQYGIESMLNQFARVCQVVHSLR